MEDLRRPQPLQGMLWQGVCIWARRSLMESLPQGGHPRSPVPQPWSSAAGARPLVSVPACSDTTEEQEEDFRLGARVIQGPFRAVSLGPMRSSDFVGSFWARSPSFTHGLLFLHLVTKGFLPATGRAHRASLHQEGAAPAWRGAVFPIACSPGRPPDGRRGGKEDSISDGA